MSKKNYICFTRTNTKIAMKQIVVPVDFSSESLNGLRLGIIFANRFEIPLQMIHIVKQTSDLGREGSSDKLKEIEKTFEEIKKEFAPNFHDEDQFGYIIKQGKVYREIINHANAVEDTAIITSTHGASGFEEFFMGSNSFKIVSSAQTPVITIRHGAVAQDVRVIVLPIDASINSRQKVPYSAEVAQQFGSVVHVVGHSGKRSGDEAKVSSYTKQACDYFIERGIKVVRHRIDDENMVDPIIEYALSVHANLISIMTEQSPSFVDFIIGSNAQQMLNKSPVPVLCMSSKDVFLLGSYK